MNEYVQIQIIDMNRSIHCFSTNSHEKNWKVI